MAAKKKTGRVFPLTKAQRAGRARGVAVPRGGKAAPKAAKAGKGGGGGGGSG